MILLVDTSVWLLAFGRNGVPSVPEVFALQRALLGAEQVFITGLVLQELLHGFNGRRAKAELLSRLAALACRRHGLQIGTIDAVLIQLCRRHELTLLSADQDFAAAARWVGFRLWRGA